MSSRQLRGGASGAALFAFFVAAVGFACVGIIFTTKNITALDRLQRHAAVELAEKAKAEAEEQPAPPTKTRDYTKAWRVTLHDKAGKRVWPVVLELIAFDAPSEQERVTAARTTVRELVRQPFHVKLLVPVDWSDTPAIVNLYMFECLRFTAEPIQWPPPAAAIKPATLRLSDNSLLVSKPARGS